MLHFTLEAQECAAPCALSELEGQAVFCVLAERVVEVVSLGRRRTVRVLQLLGPRQVFVDPGRAEVVVLGHRAC